MNDRELTPEGRRRQEAVIHRQCDLADRVITYNDEGWDSHVYLVNGGEAVFKFPRSAAAKGQYRHEISALRLLAQIDKPVRTPRLRWQADDLSWFGYEGIVGTALSTVIDDLDNATKEMIGTRLGRFLARLHAADLPDAPTTGIEDEIAGYLDKYRLAGAALTGEFTRPEMDIIEKFFLEELPGELRRLGGVLRLGHGDLGPWNIIIDNHRDVAVIDFGDVGYYDVSKDFSGFGDETILNAAFAGYGGHARLREKAAIRIRALPVLDIPFYLGKRDRAGVNACLDLVRRVIVDGADSHDARFTRD